MRPVNKVLSGPRDQPLRHLDSPARGGFGGLGGRPLGGAGWRRPAGSATLYTVPVPLVFTGSTTVSQVSMRLGGARLSV